MYLKKLQETSDCRMCRVLPWNSKVIAMPNWPHFVSLLPVCKTTLRTIRWAMSTIMEVCFDRSFLMNNRTCKQQLKNLLFQVGLLEVSWRTTPRHWTLIKHAKNQNGSTSSFVDETRGKAFFESTQKSIARALEFPVLFEEAIVPFLGVLLKRLH